MLLKYSLNAKLPKDGVAQVCPNGRGVVSPVGRMGRALQGRELSTPGLQSQGKRSEASKEVYTTGAKRGKEEEMRPQSHFLGSPLR